MSDSLRGQPPTTRRLQQGHAQDARLTSSASNRSLRAPEDHKSSDTSIHSGSHSLHQADSRSSLHEEFAASRQEIEFDFDEDDEPENVKKTTDISHEIRRILLSAIVPVVLFSNDDASTETLLWVIGLPWAAYAAWTFGLPWTNVKQSAP